MVYDTCLDCQAKDGLGWPVEGEKRYDGKDCIKVVISRKQSTAMLECSSSKYEEAFESISHFISEEEDGGNDDDEEYEPPPQKKARSGSSGSWRSEKELVSGLVHKSVKQKSDGEPWICCGEHLPGDRLRCFKCKRWKGGRGDPKLILD